MTYRFSKTYFAPALIIFAIEFFIAIFVNDRFVRPFVGDVLVVILLYCFLRIFLEINYWKAAVGVLLFACLIEIFQYFDYVKLLGLENNRVLSIAMGRSFAWLDFAAYFAGFLVIILTEKSRGRFEKR